MKHGAKNRVSKSCQVIMLPYQVSCKRKMSIICPFSKHNVKIKINNAKGLCPHAKHIVKK